MAKIDPQDVLRSADSFAAACHLLHAAAQKGHVVMTNVAATLEALTVESFLKCLIMLETGVYRSGHDLYKLFKTLPDQTKSELKTAFSEHIAKFPSFEADAKKRGYPTDLESLLILGRHSFADFRYAHQSHGKKTVFGLHGLGVCARQRILRIKPEWEITTWQHLE